MFRRLKLNKVRAWCSGLKHSFRGVQKLGYASDSFLSSRQLWSLGFRAYGLKAFLLDSVLLRP